MSDTPTTEGMTTADWLRAYAGWLSAGQFEMLDPVQLEEAADELDAKGSTDWNEVGPKLLQALRPIIERAEWNGYRQGWDIRCDLPAGSINAARAAIASAESKD